MVKPSVAADLRSPLIPFASVPYTPATLPWVRPLFRLPRWSGPAVAVATRYANGDPDVRVRVTTPRTERPHPGVLWLHTGGTISGSPQFEGPMTGYLARQVGAVVVAPDYRLAPENPHPAAIDDCLATVHWMRKQADALGIDPDRIAVAGASAGGGLAATLAQRCNDEGIDIRAQALLYPMLDDRTPADSGLDAPVWSSASNHFGWVSYLGAPGEPGDDRPYTAPARRSDLTGTPPTWLAVGDLDILLEETLNYAARLADSGVTCEHQMVPGMYHAADLLVPWAKSMRALRADMAAFLWLHLTRR